MGCCARDAYEKCAQVGVPEFRPDLGAAFRGGAFCRGVCDAADSAGSGADATIACTASRAREADGRGDCVKSSDAGIRLAFDECSCRDSSLDGFVEPYSEPAGRIKWGEDYGAVGNAHPARAAQRDFDAERAAGRSRLFRDALSSDDRWPSGDSGGLVYERRSDGIKTRRACEGPGGAFDQVDVDDFAERVPGEFERGAERRGYGRERVDEQRRADRGRLGQDGESSNRG